MRASRVGPVQIQPSLHSYRDVILARASLIGLEIEPEAVRTLALYLTLLSRWNETIRLTSLDEPEAAVDRLILEPVKAAAWLPRHSLSLMDIGSGGGSPAIPLKVIRPNASLLMVESRSRKAAFLREAASELSLDHTTVETARFEDLGSRWRATMDALSVRAVRIDSPTLLALSNFLKPGGCVLAFTSTARAELILPPGLVLEATLPLVPANSSELVVLRRN